MPPSWQIFAYLGNTSFSKRDERDDPYSPEFRAITPHKHLPEGFQFKGMMVCSDGVQLFDENNHLTREAAEKALSVLFANNNTPDPQEIAQAMVRSAMPDPNDPHFKHSNDNITAVFLPAGGKGLIAVADGNNGTAKVAITALDVLHEQCIAAMRTQGQKGGIVSNGNPQLGAQAPAHEMPRDVRECTAPGPNKQDLPPQ